MHHNSNRKRGLQRLRLYLILISSSFALTACPPKTPSQSQLVDTRIAELIASETVYAADAIPNEQRAGQWLQYKSIDENDEPTILTYKIIASDGFNHSVELVEEDYHGKYVTYMELRYDPGRALKSLDVKRVLTRRGDSLPKESSPEDLSVKEAYHRVLASQLFAPWADGTSGGDIVVGAGQFQGCLQIEISLMIKGLIYRADSWHHPSLPMNGLVKAVRKDGTEGTVELLDFGLDGARSDVLRTVQ